jgi:hypothetical protein
MEEGCMRADRFLLAIQDFSFSGSDNQTLIVAMVREIDTLTRYQENSVSCHYQMKFDAKSKKI